MQISDCSCWPQKRWLPKGFLDFYLFWRKVLTDFFLFLPWLKLHFWILKISFKSSLIVWQISTKQSIKYFSFTAQNKKKRRVLNSTGVHFKTSKSGDGVIITRHRRNCQSPLGVGHTFLCSQHCFKCKSVCLKMGIKRFYSFLQVLQLISR